ncbi:MAG: MBL fold metallo-hydrolase [Puniceicoccales bacterium]|jgi:phosphoribosyl 1,2-cyclic phosphodiesterase|nr:MBL fold metallo-hydrolase [Puniceicoccales bacterium]
MNFRFHILGSSSSGNCALLVTPRSRVLIDAGFSARRIKQALNKLGEDVANIDAVFITHEHCDHIEGIPGLARGERIVFFANSETARAVLATCAGARPRWRIFETGSSFVFQDIAVSAFSIPHDAADPVGYTFTVEDNATVRTLAWVTDLGHVPQLVREKIRSADCLVLESNYDAGLLEKSPRPPSLKQRIRGRHGHLSNELAQELLMTLDSARLRHVFLAHLSRECNSPALVEAALAPVRALRADCRFTVVPPDAAAPLSL